MKYGFFDDEAREYVITTPKTPVKWINYVGNLSFGGFVDQTGGGLLCKGDPSLNRIVKYITQMPAGDFKGQGLYVRYRTAKKIGGGSQDGEHTWQLGSPFFVPTLNGCETWQCRVGLGYNRWLVTMAGLYFDIKVFVPRGQNREIRDIRVKNTGQVAVELDLIPIVEYTHFDALKQLTNADWVPQTMQSRAIREKSGHIVLCQAAFMKKGVAENYLTSNHPVDSFETDRKRFLGDNEYGTWAHPLSLDEPHLSCYETRRGDNIGALLHKMGTIDPGAEVRLITQLGQEADPAVVLPEIAQWRDHAVVDAAFAELSRFWTDYLSVYRVQSPDPAFDTMINVHNPRQCYMTKNWSRYLSYYQLGFGSDRGIGFRDSSQDIMGVMAHMPSEALELAEKLLSVQKRDGSAMHQFNPLTMVGAAGETHEHPDRPPYYSDDHLWIVLAVTAYLKETGDLAFVDKCVPFYDKGPDGMPVETGTVAEHLKRALAFTHGDLGTHGLPHAGYADWNDTVNLKTGAESLFTANLYGKALLEMIELSEVIGDRNSMNTWKSWYEEMKVSVNREAWDGDWFVRYFDHDGVPIGTSKAERGKIWINSQTWAVISGFADAGYGRRCLDSVNKHLNTKNGIKLSAPGYDGFDPAKGGVTTYPPGAKENGGIFLHTNPWAIIAECILGNGDRAWQYYSQINPAARNDRIDEFEVEPYVYPQNMLGDEHPQFGLGRNSWLSGTASWAYQAASQYILGIRAGYDGLIVDPCIPKEWKTYTIFRRFRGTEYRIVVENPNGTGRGVRTLVIDGRKISEIAIAGGPFEGSASLGASGCVLPLAAGQGACEVKVILG